MRGGYCVGVELSIQRLKTDKVVKIATLSVCENFEGEVSQIR